MRKMYVIVRKDLSPAVQAVQGGHALAGLLQLDPDIEWRNSTLVFLGVRGQAQLHNLHHKFGLHNVICFLWDEPDMNDQVTALAVYVDENILKSVNCI